MTGFDDIQQVEAAVMRLAETVQRQHELIAATEAAGGDPAVAECLLETFSALLRDSEMRLLRLRLERPQ